MTPESFLNGRVILWCADMRDALARLEENSVDSCVCDPPYHLTSIVKRFGAENAAPAKVGKTGAYNRAAAGFMGKKWDGGDVAFQVETWRAVFRVLKPGAHIVAFSGTRTYHRMVCAIEDAGFEVRDQIGWAFGSGFPKSHDVSKGIDKANGAERSKIRIPASQLKNPPNLVGGAVKGDDRPWRESAIARGFHEAVSDEAVSDEAVSDEAVSDEAVEWQGWGTALKPAWEPVVLARKPLSEGTIAANVLRWGTGALNIDGCRVGATGGPASSGAPNYKNEVYGRGMGGLEAVQLDAGRWPANVIHDGSEEVVGAFPERDGAVSNGKTGVNEIYGGGWGSQSQEPGYADSGSAARFFYQAKYDDRCELCDASIVRENFPTGNIPAGASVLCDAVDSPPLGNASSEHRSKYHVNGADGHSKHCHPPSVGSALPNAQAWPLSKIAQNVSDAAGLCSLCAMAIARALVEVRRKGCPVPVHFNPSIGSSRETILSRSLASYVESRESTDTILTTTNLSELFGCVFRAIAANTSSERVGSEANTRPASSRLFYSSKADSDDRLGSRHPTVKPVDLIQYLVRLVTPPKGIVLDCFAGTGTTGEAAYREGCSAILIEREAEYQADIRRRMALVLAGPDERLHATIKAKGLTQDAGPLFGGADEKTRGGGRQIYGHFADQDARLARSGSSGE